MQNLFQKSIAESIKIKSILQEDKYLETFELVGNLLTKCIINGGKILLCGNGGSAADAQHLAAELLVRFRSELNRAPIPAIALTMDTSTITACGNDLGYDYLFQRNVLALGKKNDILICISTSGMSKNINLAAKAARLIGMKTIGLLGNEGGIIKSNCDLSLIVPSKNTARIQECHIIFGHTLVEFLENNLLECGYIKKVNLKSGKLK